MKTPLKVLLIAGARPNFMKVAPLVKAIAAHNQNAPQGQPEITFKLVHTGQHYDAKMSAIFFQELGIPEPDLNLEVGAGSHAAQTATIMTRFEPVCLQEKPDWVLVVGDVNSTMACTLVAAKLGIKVAHVEAGLRSFDRTMPEELNRLVTDALADLLLTPSEDAGENLRREGIAESKIRLVGNVMIDTLLANLPQARNSPLPARLKLTRRGFVYVTLHRPSNVDDRRTLELILAELNRLSTQLPVVFPVHPRTRKMFNTFNLALDGKPNLKLLDPLGYHDSLWLTENARFVLTDSGGLQEESTCLLTPCLTLRPNTERPITIRSGTNKLTSPERLAADIQEVLLDQRPRGRVPPLWDGKTAPRIVQAILGRAQPEPAPATCLA